MLSVLLLPAHYHLHHLDSIDSAAHAHAIDLHVITDEQALTHHDEGTSIFSATPDGIVKKVSPVVLPGLLLVFSLLILSVCHYRIRCWSVRDDPNPDRWYPFFTPLLRAPPVR
ncbi:MAG: hypothetical protein HKO86_01330 [Gammaproteobacteria bacterium]|nr:hypothetical protein [Gammaproteobacteria bacterium]